MDSLEISKDEIKSEHASDISLKWVREKTKIQIREFQMVQYHGSKTITVLYIDMLGVSI